MSRYAAYGSNLNLEQMKRRCPDSNVVGRGKIIDFELEFRYFANIAESIGQEVPVVLWNISEKDEGALDRYEGVSSGLYRKETVKVKLDSVNDSIDLVKENVSGEVEALIYIMNTEDKPIEAPSSHYYDVIREGYRDNGLDVRPLAVAAIKSGAKFVEE